MAIIEKEKKYLRDLAKLQKELSNSPENKLREQTWYAHNDLNGNKPIIVFEDSTFWCDIKPESKCTSDDAKFIEDLLLRNIVPTQIIRDDRVVPDYISINIAIWSDNYGVKNNRIFSKDSKGREIGFSDQHLFTNIEDFESFLKPSNFFFDFSSFSNQKSIIEETLGDILPINIKNRSLLWVTLTEIIVRFMGMDNFYTAMYDCPDGLHKLMAFLRNEIIRYERFQEANGLLSPNWDNSVICGCSHGYTKKLPKSNPTKINLAEGPTDIKTRDQWINMNSQETVGIAPHMYKEFILPYYHDLASLFGQVYYGCCEPVHDIFEDGIEKIENLRKISISPWCNQQKMAEYLRGRDIIFSRKISPNYLGVTSELDEEAFTKHIDETLIAARGLPLEILSRDVYSLNGNVSKLARAIEIIRERIEKKYI